MHSQTISREQQKYKVYSPKPALTPDVQDTRGVKSALGEYYTPVNVLEYLFKIVNVNGSLPVNPTTAGHHMSLKVRKSSATIGPRYASIRLAERGYYRPLVVDAASGSRSPLRTLDHRIKLYFTPYRYKMPEVGGIIPVWVNRVKKRLQAAALQPGETFIPRQTISSSVSADAQKFFDLFGDLFSVEPYISSSSDGDLIAQFTLGSKDIIIVFFEKSVFMRDSRQMPPLTLSLTDWMTSGSEIRRFFEHHD